MPDSAFDAALRKELCVVSPFSGERDIVRRVFKVAWNEALAAAKGVCEARIRPYDPASGDVPPMLSTRESEAYGCAMAIDALKEPSP